ncbi:MAG: response regulator [Verrucomicrobia bacterium]|nr:response regulator [Verrucomicrobiota bacterium]
MTPTDLAPYDILIVDDSNAILSHVLNTLNSPQFRCRVARTAQSGLEQIRTRLPDLLLLDCQLDGSHKGSEVLAGCPSPHAPVTIVFSASAEEADTMFQRFEQVSSRILKPFSNEELRTHVREALEENADTIAAIRRALDAAVQPPSPAEASVPPPDPVTVATPTTEFLPVAAPHGDSEGPTGDDELLLQSFLGSPGLQRELAHSLRGLLGLAGRPLVCGPVALLSPSQVLEWSLRQTHPMLVVTLREAHEVIEVYVASARVVGVATDTWPGAARGQAAPPASDPDGGLQGAALRRFLSPREGGLLEVRELTALPAWILQQPGPARTRLASGGHSG